MGEKKSIYKQRRKILELLKVLENNVVKGGGTKRRKMGGHTKLCIKCKPASQDTQMCVCCTNKPGGTT
jgi:hypothetical protein